MSIRILPQKVRLLCLVVLLAAPCRRVQTQQAQQSRGSGRIAAQLEELSRGPHLGSPEEAVVGIEVSNKSADGAVEQVKRGSGFVLRCDGFVLAPSSLFGRGISVAGANETAAQQVITLIVRPGTPREQRIAAKPPRFVPRDVPYAVVKAETVHLPALRTLLPDALNAGDTAQVVGVTWDAATKHFRITPRAEAALSAVPASDSAPEPGEAGLTLTSGVAGIGAVVIGPRGLAIGLITGSSPDSPERRFTSFAVLNRATNCVTPLAVPPGEDARDADMVDVPGGAFVLPAAIVKDQPDMAGFGVACVAPFKIDRVEVSNQKYLDFWLTFSQADRTRLGFQANYLPASWSKTGSPFPASIADLPVIGVPMAGALAYAKSQGKRLPTPYEWAVAAFGTRGETDVEWAKRFVDDRNESWGRIKALHIEYLQFHPELQRETYYAPTHFDLPWMAASPALQNAAQWSKKTVLEVSDPLWRAWRDPLYLEPVGGREFDVSPCGARDMMLNASELVQPYPGAPINSRPRWMEVRWVRREPTDKDPWKARAMPALKELDAIPPLSRLYRRALLSPPPDELVSLSNMSEIVSMLAPLKGWELGVTQDSTITVSGLIPRRPVGAVVLSLPGFDLYAERPRHFREEMGRPVPMDHTDRSPSAGPQLYYMAPTGFRCAR